ncbi:MAG: response regulator, partial [Planctomycetota bacterium]
AQVLARMAKDPLPDLVILDFAMPVHDGEEVMRALRADARTRDVPILLATASELDLTVLGRATGLLKKPYTRTTLYAMVDRLLLAAAGPARD